MNYDVRLREEAEIDLTEASIWYQEQQPGLGHEFIHEVSSTLQSIQESPLSFPVIYRDMRRVLTRKLPFSIFYQIHTNTIIVFGILHASRDPKRWRDRT
mgnify:CR=1 FL=1|tara:strand:+ start:292 stop:588 length:297 start_codon:yes stop_codon:yes gene_type:complete